jgi:hypothetical protein
MSQLLNNDPLNGSVGIRLSAQPSYLSLDLGVAAVGQQFRASAVSLRQFLN